MAVDVSKLCNTLSHSLRTPLLVAISFIDDLQRGIKLSEEDFQDAQNALNEINALLDYLQQWEKRSPVGAKQDEIHHILKLEDV